MDHLPILAELGTAGLSLAIFIIGLMIRASQADAKADLTARIAATATDVAVHAARDEEKFHNIDAKLERIETKLDRMNGTTVVVNK